MRYFASRADRRLRETVELWKATSLDTYRAVETCQEPPDYYYEHPSWWAFEREATLELFSVCTVEVIREAKALALDPRPIQEVFDMVNAWDPGRDAGRGYGRGHLQVALRAALMILDTIEEEIRSRMVKERPIVPMPKAEAPRRQPRLSVKLNVSPPYIIFDGTPLSAPEASVHYVAALIAANGYPVAFKRWVKDHPEFEGQVSTRVVKGIPEPVRGLIDSPGKGRPPRLKVEELLAQ
jgi:hypothetical protein